MNPKPIREESSLPSDSEHESGTAAWGEVNEQISHRSISERNMSHRSRSGSNASRSSARSRLALRDPSLPPPRRGRPPKVRAHTEIQSSVSEESSSVINTGRGRGSRGRGRGHRGRNHRGRGRGSRSSSESISSSGESSSTIRGIDAEPSQRSSLSNSRSEAGARSAH